MSGPHPINITPNNNEVVFNNVNNHITITNNVDHNVVEIIQPVTTVIEINTGIVGPQGSSVVATSGSFTGSFTGSLNGTSSWSNNSITASYYGGSVISSSYSTTSSNALSSSYALTASFALNGGGGGTIDTGSLVTTASFNQFTSSYNTGSFTGSFNGVFTGSLHGTSSWSQNSLSSSYALTASFALNGGGGGTIDTGSLITTSSFNSFTSSYNSGSFTGSFTGSLFGTSSYSLTSSYIPDGVTMDGIQTLTNKRITKRVLIITSSATPTFNSDDYDFIKIISQSSAITSMTSGLSGTPTEAQLLWYQIKDNGTARAITWGASFEAKGQALPTTTTINKRLNVLFSWDTATSKWGCLDAIVET